MSGLSDKVYDKTNQELAEQELEMLINTSINWEKLRPNVTDKEAYDRLTNAVNEATQNNESQAQLQKRLTDLGAGVQNMALQVTKLLKL